MTLIEKKISITFESVNILKSRDAVLEPALERRDKDTNFLYRLESGVPIHPGPSHTIPVDGSFTCEAMQVEYTAHP